MMIDYEKLREVCPEAAEFEAEAQLYRPGTNPMIGLHVDHVYAICFRLLELAQERDMVLEHRDEYATRYAEEKLAAVKAEAEVERLKDDGWRELAKAAEENGTCPSCFGTDEAGHHSDCYYGQLEAEVERLRDEVPAGIKAEIELAHRIHLECKDDHIKMLQDQLNVHREACAHSRTEIERLEADLSDARTKAEGFNWGEMTRVSNARYEEVERLKVEVAKWKQFCASHDEARRKVLAEVERLKGELAKRTRTLVRLLSAAGEYEENSTTNAHCEESRNRLFMMMDQAEAPEVKDE